MDKLLENAPVVPVVVIDDADKAVPVAEALVAGGLPVIEITMRTTAAPEAIAAIARDVPDAFVGAGTVLSTEQAETIVAAEGAACGCVDDAIVCTVMFGLAADGVGYGIHVRAEHEAVTSVVAINVNDEIADFAAVFALLVGLIVDDIFGRNAHLNQPFTQMRRHSPFF